MGNQKENNDELLFGLLSEKLYSHYCGTEEEHLSTEEEQAVINIMNSLQVDEADDFNPTNSFKKFCEKYMVEEAESAKEKKVRTIEDLLEEMERDLKDTYVKEEECSFKDKLILALEKMGRMRMVRRVALAVLVVIVMFCGMNIGTYATAKMGFFEFLTMNDKGWSFMVTGEGTTEETVGMDDITQKTYDSWEEVKQLDGMEGMLVPQWVPDESELLSVIYIEGTSKETYIGQYFLNEEEKFQLIVEKYNENVVWHYFFQSQGVEYEEEKLGERKMLWYTKNDGETGFFANGNIGYHVSGQIKNEEIKEIIKNLK